MNKTKRWWLTPCGLDCNKCSIHLRTDEELEYWRRKKVDLDKIRCDGCRSDRQLQHWSLDCKILQCCVYERGFEFCAQCSEFPCETLKEWGAEYDHHAQALKRLAALQVSGIEKWLAEQGY